MDMRIGQKSDKNRIETFEMRYMLEKKMLGIQWRERTNAEANDVKNDVFTAQCTLVHMRGLGIACRPSVRPSVCDVGGL